VGFRLGRIHNREHFDREMAVLQRPLIFCLQTAAQTRLMKKASLPHSG
jgi:hypothetical protein